MKIIRHRNYWAIKITQNKSIFIDYDGKDTWIEIQPWEQTKYDFLDYVGFERRAEFFGVN